jgi:uncharacterized protein YndB with AHSA1/START domain
MEKEAVKEFTITRTFNAPLDLVWKVNTEAKHLEKWWGPKGLKMLHCTLDLRPGGVFHYGMQAPNGAEMWGKFVYREVTPKTKLVYVVSFSDKDQGITRHPMAPGWPAEVLCTMTLTEKDGKTILTVTGNPINATAEECALYFNAFPQMNEGFKGTYDQLEAYLSTLQ